jgi:hypothetical protein
MDFTQCITGRNESQFATGYLVYGVGRGRGFAPDRNWWNAPAIRNLWNCPVQSFEIWNSLEVRVVCYKRGSVG